MSEDFKQTVRLVRRGKVRTDDRGRTVWAEPVEDVELELVSTQMLKNMLGSGDDERKERLRAAAEERDGVLAQNVQSGSFEVIDDDDLDAALKSVADDSGPGRVADVVSEPVAGTTPDEDGELSLVSTQMLRRILGQEEEHGEQEPGAVEAEQGFDPYNSS